MTTLLIALIGLSIVVLVLRERDHEQRLIEREKTWDLERGALITRIQHPEIVVAPPEEVRPDEDFLTADPPDDLDLVGTVQNGD